VILIDANLLLYAKIADYPQHPQAHRWLDEQFNGTARVGLAWPSLLAFLRICTNPRLFRKPLAIDKAWKQMIEWLELSTTWIPQATDRHPAILGQLVTDSSIVSNLVPDAHLAALAIEHGLRLCTTDGDFARFKGLEWMNPLRS